MLGAKFDAFLVAITVAVLLSVMAILVFDPFAGPSKPEAAPPPIPPPRVFSID